MMTFEFQYIAECGTALHIGIVEAENLSEAAREVANFAEFLRPDADAVRLTIFELVR